MKPPPDRSPHRHFWRVLHQPNGPTCACGASLVAIIETARRAREERP